MSAQIPQETGVGYKRPPKHTRFGQPNGNPFNRGGVQKGFVFPSETYKRFSTYSPDELRDCTPRNAIEAACKRLMLMAMEADEWQAVVAALKEITDRVEGKAPQTMTVIPADIATRAAQDFKREQIVNEREQLGLSTGDIIEIVCEGYEPAQRPLIERELAQLVE